MTLLRVRTEMGKSDHAVLTGSFRFTLIAVAGNPVLNRPVLSALLTLADLLAIQHGFRKADAARRRLTGAARHGLLSVGKPCRVCTDLSVAASPCAPTIPTG